MSIVTIKNDNIAANIDMEDGMNVVSLIYRGVDIVEFDKDRKESGATYAIPILFPTPNRTSGGKYIYSGVEVPALMHGYARHSSFEIIDLGRDFVKGYHNFKYFDLCPYDVDMYVVISVASNSVKWQFSVINKGRNEFPFSIALHPFFKKSVFNRISSTVEEMMINDGNLIPTGETTNAIGMFDDRDVGNLDIDAVFLSQKAIESRLIGKQFALYIKGDEDFRHVVIYTAPDKPFICVEPQTGSTDFINLFNKGFVRESNLLKLNCGEEKELSVEFSFIDF